MTVLEFDGDSQLDVAYLEGLGRADQVETRPAEIARYRGELERLSARALDQDSTRNMIQSLLTS